MYSGPLLYLTLVFWLTLSCILTCSFGFSLVFDSVIVLCAHLQLWLILSHPFSTCGHSISYSTSICTCVQPNLYSWITLCSCLICTQPHWPTVSPTSLLYRITRRMSSSQNPQHTVYTPAAHQPKYNAFIVFITEQDSKTMFILGIGLRQLMIRLTNPHLLNIQIMKKNIQITFHLKFMMKNPLANHHLFSLLMIHAWMLTSMFNYFLMVMMVTVTMMTLERPKLTPNAWRH